MRLTVSVAQMAVASADPRENLRKGETLIACAADRKSDIVAFPEMWTTGFNWEYNRRALADQQAVIDHIAGLAKKYRIWVTGSMLAPDEAGRPANTAILFDPEGARTALYRKAHLFGLIHENEHMTPGNALTTVDTPWGVTGLSVCYDIRFPELFRTYALKGAKIVFSPMAFPLLRLNHWKVLIRARAIEDQLFMIGTNQVGSEDHGKDGVITYCGHSAIIDPWGETVIEANEKEETLLTATIELDKVDKTRAAMPVLKDRRPELYDLR